MDEKQKHITEKFGVKKLTHNNEMKIRKGRKWYKSHATGRWFLYGVGSVKYTNLHWIARILHRKIKPKVKAFDRMTDAMDWVADRGGNPSWK